WVSLEPGSRGIGVAIGKQVDDGAEFRFDEDRAVATSLAIDPIIDAQYPRGRTWRRKKATGLAQESMRTDGDVKLGSDPGSGLAAQSIGEVVEPLGQPL